MDRPKAKTTEFKISPSYAEEIAKIAAAATKLGRSVVPQDTKEASINYWRKDGVVISYFEQPKYQTDLKTFQRIQIDLGGLKGGAIFICARGGEIHAFSENPEITNGQYKRLITILFDAAEALEKQENQGSLPISILKRKEPAGAT